MKNAFVLFILINIFGFQLNAQILTLNSETEAYQLLIQDFYEEAKQVDWISFSTEERLALQETIQSRLSQHALHKWKATEIKKIAGIFPIRKFQVDNKTKQQVDFNALNPNTIRISTENHSILDIHNYISARIGLNIARLTKDDKINIDVIAGDYISLESHLGRKFPGLIANEIPSFYSAWGINKYLVNRPGEKPTLIFLIPPSEKYLTHYLEMLLVMRGNHAKNTLLTASLDQSSIQRYENRVEHSLDEIKLKLDAKPDHIVLGYYNQWLSILKQNSGRFKILEVVTEVKTSFGLMGKKILIRDNDSRKTIELLLLANEKTIWGELSSIIIAKSLRLSPASVIFMGSAGAIRQDLNPYDLSAPKSFQTESGLVLMRNYLADWNARRLVNNIQLHVDGVHGNTNSPAEQDLAYLLRMQSNGVSTLDVEQSLIAETIAKYNQRYKQDIKFGAINLITDKPGHILAGDRSEHDLQEVDHVKKGNSRNAAVLIALNGIAELEVRLPVCRKVLPK